MSEESLHKVVLFADFIQGSGLFSELGDTWAVDIIADVHAQLREIVARHQGRLVKTVGTEVICIFATCGGAALAAGEMHMQVRDASEDASRVSGGNIGEVPGPADPGSNRARLRVGMHLGPILEEEDDVFGDTVNVSARLMAMAKAEQTLCSRVVVDGLPSELQATTRFFDRISPRGKVETVEIHEVLWEVDDLTVAAPVSLIPRLLNRHANLDLHCEGTDLQMGAELPVLTIGRSKDNDLVYPGGFASRKHAMIEFGRGRFAIVDHSANGTYVVPDGGKTVPVRRERHVLDGDGSIYLGELPSEKASSVIRYRCH